MASKVRGSRMQSAIIAELRGTLCTDSCPFSRRRWKSSCAFVSSLSVLPGFSVSPAPLLPHHEILLRDRRGEAFFLSLPLLLSLMPLGLTLTNLNIHLYKRELIRAQNTLCALYFCLVSVFSHSLFFLLDLPALCYAPYSLINVKHTVTLLFFKWIKGLLLRATIASTCPAEVSLSNALNPE